MSREDLLDALDELQHDLGKYLRLPLAMLPRDAGPELVREAAQTALLRTRRGAGGVTSAEDIWRAFVDEVGAALPLNTLEPVVARALAWRGRLDELDREALEADLGAVSGAIRALMESLQSD